MATLLYRIGRFSYRRAWIVIGVWLVSVVGVLGGSVALGGQTQESFAIPGTESQTALDRLDAVFPSVAGASAQAIVVAPKGGSISDPAFTAAITKMDAKIADIKGIDSVVSPFSQYAGNAISGDGRRATRHRSRSSPRASTRPTPISRPTTRAQRR